MLAASLVAAGCTYEWNDTLPPFPLSGSAPSLASFDKLNQVVAGRPAKMTGPDGATWIAFCEFWPMGNGNSGRTCKKERLVRLGLPGEPSVEESIDADSFSLHPQMLYEMRDDTMAMTRTVTLHRPGDPKSADASFQFPSGRALLVANDSGNADVFVYGVQPPKGGALTLGVYRRDKRFQRALPTPTNIDLTKEFDASAFDFYFTADGSALVVRDGDGNMISYSTLDDGKVALGMRPAAFAIDDDRRRVITIGKDGLRSVALDGSGERLLTATHIDLSTLTLDFDDGAVFYADTGGLMRVPLDGSAPPSLAQAGGARLWMLGPNGEVTYSRDSRSKYAGGAGDGWLGARRFMERGRQLRWSSDGARLHFLEHAATVGTYGDLTSVSAAGDAPRTLGINVHVWDELPDHRILAVENAVYSGAWNRLVVIDEVASTKHWLVPSTNDFMLVNDGTELIADVVSGASGFDILRVPAPQ
jgi:hypothetical protein